MTSPHADIESLLPKENASVQRERVAAARPTRPYQTLPHVGIGDITGLIELVYAKGGREDLYQLGRDLQLEVDELLPLVDATDLLNLADPQEGDMVLTDIDRHFAEAGVLEEKQIFRAQALQRIGMLNRIVEDLRNAPDHIVPEERYLEQLKQHFSEDEAWSQLETIIDWGRYAEVFSYVEDRGIFRLEDPEIAE